MKRFLMILLLFVFIVSMTACSSSGEEKNVQKNNEEIGRASCRERV